MAKTIVIPSNPADIKRIKDAVKSSSDCLVRIESEKEEMKAIVELMNVDLEIPKSVFKKLVTVYHKQNYDKVVTDAEDFSEFYDKVMA